MTLEGLERRGSVVFCGATLDEGSISVMLQSPSDLEGRSGRYEFLGRRDFGS